MHHTAAEPTPLTGVVTHLGNAVTAVHLALTEDAFGVSLLLYTGAIPATPGAAPLPPIVKSVFVPQKHCYFSAKGSSTPACEGTGLSPK